MQSGRWFFDRRLVRLRHRRQLHDQTRIDEPLEMGRERLGEGPVADGQTSLDIPLQRFRHAVRGGHEDLVAVLDDGLVFRAVFEELSQLT
ncbi:MAG: hypothetical protein EBT09_05550 [Actinobacteria bacterium]|nr:hypothetical protein [Actinomycetota bacterium]